ncbi:hypothetical protein K458DRAFT_355257 [Lentithecium fluviatile CBS 122367]|uniref:Uncharacterized protein n=1 Tax=Lentithecium fluviatile CBS 122367 TaxID=1168545 RepID=A0A6G1JL95_9PLEO|nr:hypothetical protein K458DRAFT_355257 [Lentithecium fluviatile CBS 122367]
MTTASLLSGKRMGYYYDRRYLPGNNQSYRVDPPMHTIELVVDEAVSIQYTHSLNERIKWIIFSASRGVDSYGTFQLNGTVSETGNVTIIKTYVTQGWSWMWHGTVMPFGIVGVLGDIRGVELGGYFWIWKQD